MGAYRIRGTALTLATLATLAGCQPPPPPPPTPTTREASLGQAAPTTAPSADAAEGSAEALARKAEQWAKMMEALQAKRNTPSTQVAVATSRPAADGQARADAVHGPASRPVEAAAPPAPAPAPAKSAGATPALVFSPPPTTAPVIEVHAPAASTQPAASLPPAPPKVVVKDQLVERIREGLKSAPRDAAANLDYQLVRFLRDEQTPDLASLSNLSGEDREAVAALMDGLANFRAGLRADPNAMLSKKVRPLVDMGDRVRAQGDLQIPSAALCSAVKGYGLYDPLGGPFTEGRENRALLYCEITGFAARLGEGSMWETRLTQEVVLYRGEAEVWKKGKVDQIVDRCRNKRHDFYVTNLIQLPASLAAGSYSLKVTVIDQVANRVAETVVPVSITAANVAGAGK